MARSHPSTRTRPPIVPWRYALFLALFAISAPLAMVLSWQIVLMCGFDIAALAFLATLPSLFRHDERRMRDHARANDANRRVMLLITGVVMLAILVAVATELHQRHQPSPSMLVLVLATLCIAWLFSNIIYALHYAFLFYSATEDGSDRRGIRFPDTISVPDYWDFAYFSFTLGMTFQTSDVDVTSPAVRKVVLLHSMAAFVFNLGILAFTINVLGG